MTTPTRPAPVEVAAPTLVPYGYGLLAAATVLDDSESARWRQDGVVYGSICSPDSAGVWIDRCVTPAPVTAFVVTWTKAQGSNDLVATLTARHPGYGSSAVFVNVDAQGAQSLDTIGDTATFPVVAETTVTLLASNTAVGVYPQCSDTDELPVPEQADGARATSFCRVTPAVAADQLKLFTHDMQQVQGMPFQVTDTVACWTISGRTLDELESIARARIAVHESAQVEREFWNRELGGLGPTVTVLAPPSGTAWDLGQAVGQLSHEIRVASGANGVIHAPDHVADPAMGAYLLRERANQYLTALGHVWSFGAGYLNASPEGVPAPPGQAWIYGTGPVVLRRTPLAVYPLLHHHGNENQVLAERSYVATADCPVFAALVDLPES